MNGLNSLNVVHVGKWVVEAVAGQLCLQNVPVDAEGDVLPKWNGALDCEQSHKDYDDAHRNSPKPSPAPRYGTVRSGLRRQERCFAKLPSWILKQGDKVQATFALLRRVNLRQHRLVLEPFPQLTPYQTAEIVQGQPRRGRRVAAAQHIQQRTGKHCMRLIFRRSRNVAWPGGAEQGDAELGQLPRSPAGSPWGGNTSASFTPAAPSGPSAMNAAVAEAEKQQSSKR